VSGELVRSRQLRAARVRRPVNERCAVGVPVRPGVQDLRTPAGSHQTLPSGQAPVPWGPVGSAGIVAAGRPLR